MVSGKRVTYIVEGGSISLYISVVNRIKEHVHVPSS